MYSTIVQTSIIQHYWTVFVPSLKIMFEGRLIGIFFDLKSLNNVLGKGLKKIMDLSIKDLTHPTTQGFEVERK